MRDGLKTLYLLVLLVSTALAQTPEDAAGSWQGTIEIPDSPLQIVVTLEALAGELSGTVDIPAQGAQALPLGDVMLEGESISFVIEGVDGDPSFDGTLANDTLAGTFSQGGEDFTFALTRADAPQGNGAAETGEPAPAEAEIESTYDDPEGRFSVPLPTNWTIEENDGYATLLSPEGDMSVYVLALPEADVEAAIDEGWALVDPDFDLEPSDTQEPPSEPGVERTLVLTYEDQDRVAQAFAKSFEGSSYLFLLYADLAAAQRRAAQLNIIASGFAISGLEEADITGAEPLVVDEAVTADLATYIDDALERFDIPGAAVAIVQDGEIVYEGGFGVKEKGGSDPITADTSMKIGSTGKSLTTLLMASLVDDGLMTWDTAVKELLPEFSLADLELSETITMRNLVCACTGVPRRDFELIFNAEELGAEAIVESLESFDLFTDFGEAFQYSNQMVGTGGYAAAAADGADWGGLFAGYTQSLQRRVLDPIGMPNTTLSLEEVKARGDYALPHSFNLTGENNSFSVDLEELLTPIAPAGAHWSTASDMARYLITELNIGVAPDGDRVVSEENLRVTWEPQVEVSATERYGLGWFIRDYKGLSLIEHGGNTFGFTSDFAFLPEQNLGIVILTNEQGSNAFNAAVRERLFELVFEQDPQADVQATFAFEQAMRDLAEAADSLEPVDVATLEPYLGIYSNAELGEVSLRLEGEDVIFDSGEFAVPLVSTDDGGETVYSLNGPPLAGSELSLSEGENGPSLTFGEGATQYIFELE